MTLRLCALLLRTLFLHLEKPSSLLPRFCGGPQKLWILLDTAVGYLHIKLKTPSLRPRDVSGAVVCGLLCRCKQGFYPFLCLLDKAYVRHTACTAVHKVHGYLSKPPLSLPSHILSLLFSLCAYVYMVYVYGMCLYVVVVVVVGIDTCHTETRRGHQVS